MRRDQYLSYDEMWRLREDAESRSKDSEADMLAWMVVDLALQTGLRVAEMTLIKPRDIDFDREFIRVWRVKKRDKLKADLVPLSKTLAAHLREHIKWLEDGCRHPWTDTLWPGQRGPWSRRGLQQAWDRACSRVGIKLSIHGARHTIATHMLRTTGNLRMVQKQLGHCSPAITAKHYADVPLEDMIKTLDGLFER